MESLPRPGTPVLLAVGGLTFRMVLLEADEHRLVLSMGEVPPLELTRLEPEAAVTCRFHDGAVLGVFQTRVRGRVAAGAREGLELECPTQVTRSARRQHMRVSRRVPMQLRLPLRNDDLSRFRGRDFVQLCWVQATTVNIGAGGFRAMLVLPRHHSVVPHREARVRFELAGERFLDRVLNFIRRDWTNDETLLAYSFTDLSPAEMERIEGFNLSWMQAGQASEPKEGA